MLVRATHHMVGVVGYTQYIAKRNEHKCKEPTASITFGLHHTETVDKGRKLEICKKHQTIEVSGLKWMKMRIVAQRRTGCFQSRHQIPTRNG